MLDPSTFPTALRELLRTHQVFLSYAAGQVHAHDLTLPQYDIIITLGHSTGMIFKKLGEQALITKGTLTGVVSRLEDKGLVQRKASKQDGRSQIIRLTVAGRALYEASFPVHLRHVHRIFKDYSPEDLTNLEAALLQLRKAVTVARCHERGELSDESSHWCTKIRDVCKHYQEGLDQH